MTDKWWKWKKRSEWDEFFKEFDKRKLALVYDPDSMFSKIVGRDAVSPGDPKTKH